MNQPDNDDLVTLATVETEFQAGMIVAVLNEAGIPAFAHGSAHAAIPLSTKLLGVPVQVRQADIDRARAALEQNVADSVDLDWSEVDVGEAEDTAAGASRTQGSPFTRHEPDFGERSDQRMPVLAKLGFIAAVALIAGMIFAAVLTAIVLAMRSSP